MHNMLSKGQIGCLLVGTLLLSILGHCEMSIYPGLRRKPSQQTIQPQYELPTDFLAHLMGENARRRLQQQFVQQLELINMQLDRHRQLLERERYRQQQDELQALVETEDDYANNLNNQYDQYDNNDDDLSYNRNNNNVGDKYANIAYASNNNPNFDLNNNMNRKGILRERIPFAVGPSDARFYETDNNDQFHELDTKALDDYVEYTTSEAKPEKIMNQPQQMQQSIQSQQKSSEALYKSGSPTFSSASVLAPAPVESPKLLDSPVAANFHRIKPQTAAAAAVAGVSLPSPSSATAIQTAPMAANTPQHEISALIEKLQKESKSNAFITDHKGIVGQEAEQMVFRQHLGMNSEMGVYIVALIAGVSAAVTVGLLALGISWLHNRTKAAADVDYPAYGITGPNKEISPSGDRKLAHSAQMYHYQHQKQQIIAMENRQCAEGTCGLSDVESDDDNEEGDYTVYECPGLAPTGEMEVKNPLFLDETPATPANNLTTAGSAQAAAASAAITNSITQAQPQQPVSIKKGSVRTLTNLLSSSSSDDKSKRKNHK